MSNRNLIHPSLLTADLIVIEDGDKINIHLSDEKIDELGRILYMDEQESA